MPEVPADRSKPTLLERCSGMMWQPLAHVGHELLTWRRQPVEARISGSTLPAHVGRRTAAWLAASHPRSDRAQSCRKRHTGRVRGRGGAGPGRVRPRAPRRGGARLDATLAYGHASAEAHYRFPFPPSLTIKEKRRRVRIGTPVRQCYATCAPVLRDLCASATPPKIVTVGAVPRLCVTVINPPACSSFRVRYLAYLVTPARLSLPFGRGKLALLAS